MGSVLLIDDEKNAMKYYVKALERENFKVIQIETTDYAVKHFTDQKEKPDIVVLDIMMPPGMYRDNPDSDKGLKVGILLYEEIKNHCEGIPIIILTNVADPATLSELAKKASNVPIYQKINMPPFELVDIVKNVLKWK